MELGKCVNKILAVEAVNKLEVTFTQNVSAVSKPLAAVFVRHYVLRQPLKREYSTTVLNNLGQCLKEGPEFQECGTQ